MCADRLATPAKEAKETFGDKLPTKLEELCSIPITPDHGMAFVRTVANNVDLLRKGARDKQP